MAGRAMQETRCAKPQTGASSHILKVCMDNKGSPGAQLLLLAVLIFGGFFYPILFIPALAVGWAFVDSFRAEPQKNVAPQERGVNRVNWLPYWKIITSEDPDWKSYFIDVCESPAETTFLEATINEFGLVPDAGKLVGEALTLELQVEQSPYRLDFVANGWLNIEIDGAAYHSSPEAVERDAKRDEVMRSRGFVILRIPAKVVFRDGVEATRRVRDALAKGREPTSSTVTPASQAVVNDAQVVSPWSFTEALSAVGRGIDEFNNQLRVKEVVQAAIRPANNAFRRERLLISSAFKMADLEIENEDSCAKSAQHEKYFKDAYSRISSRMKEIGPVKKVSIEPIGSPNPHSDPEIDEEIKRAYNSIMRERLAFLKDSRENLIEVPRRIKHVKEYLEARCTNDIWSLIAPNVASSVNIFGNIEVNTQVFRDIPVVANASTIIPVATEGSPSRSIDDADRDVQMRVSVKKACGPARAALDAQIKALSWALANAEFDLGVRQSTGRGRAGSARLDAPRINLFPFDPPEPHGDPETDGTIQGTYEALVREQSKYFDGTRARLNEDPRLAGLMLDGLIRISCDCLWRHVAPAASPSEVAVLSFSLDDASNSAAACQDGRRQIEIAKQTALAPVQAAIEAEVTAISWFWRGVMLDLLSEDRAALTAAQRDDAWEDGYRDLFQQVTSERGSAPSLPVPAVPKPSPHEDAEVDRAILLAYRNLMEQRLAFLEDARVRLSSDSRLCDRLRKVLDEAECGSLWDRIAPVTS
jgi:very-short-patch-repair endonuclease